MRTVPNQQFRFSQNRRRFRGPGFAFGFAVAPYYYDYGSYGYTDDCYVLQQTPYGNQWVYVCDPYGYYDN